MLGTWQRASRQLRLSSACLQLRVAVAVGDWGVLTHTLADDLHSRQAKSVPTLSARLKLHAVMQLCI